MDEGKLTINEGGKRSTKFNFDDKRNLCLGYYDCSDETRNALSMEIAYDMVIPFDSLVEVFRVIGTKSFHPNLSNAQILTLLKSHYPGFISLKQILASANILHQCERDPWP